MPWNPALNPLQSVLADLYPDDTDARRIVDQAGLPAATINFAGATLNDWHDILNEADRRGKTGALIAVVQAEYPDSAALAQAVTAYRAAPLPPVLSVPDTAQPAGRWLVAAGALVVILLVVVGINALRSGRAGSTATPASTASAAATATGTVGALETPTTGITVVAATPTATPEFIPHYSFSLDAEVEQTAYDVEPGLLPSATITDYLRLTQVTLGELVGPDGADLAFDLELTLKNTDTRPLVLDLNERFFSLEDDQGRAAGLVDFCCAATGKLLEPGRERVMRLLFRGVPGWFLKHGGVSVVYLNVTGLSPVRRAQWLIHLPVTGA